MRVSLFFATVILSVCVIGFHRLPDKIAVPRKYSSFTTQCVGRNILRIPDVFRPANITTGFFKPRSALESSTYDVVVDSSELLGKSFPEHVRERRTQLKEHVSKTTDILRLEKSLSNNATLFRVQQIEDAYQSEIDFKVGDNLVVVKLDSYENSFLVAEEQLIKFMSDFSITDPAQLRGFCLGNLTLNGDYVSESADYGWSDDTGNTIDVGIDTFRKDSSKPLLERTTGPDSLLNVFHIGHSVLRSGERRVAGMRAQEWLGWTKVGTEGDKKTFGFTMETMRPVPGKKTPLITVAFDSAQKLKNGAETRTNMSNEEAMAFWDALIDSVQPVN